MLKEYNHFNLMTNFGSKGRTDNGRMSGRKWRGARQWGQVYRCRRKAIKSPDKAGSGAAFFPIRNK